MMAVTHDLIVLARCPVNGQVDEYACTVETDRVIFVERILEAASQYRNREIAQEELTQALSAELAATVTTVGRHSGVRTRVVVEPTCES